MKRVDLNRWPEGYEDCIQAYPRLPTESRGRSWPRTSEADKMVEGPRASRLAWRAMSSSQRLHQGNEPVSLPKVSGTLLNTSRLDQLCTNPSSRNPTLDDNLPDLLSQLVYGVVNA